MSASVNLILHHKVQKFSSGTGSPGWSQKKGCKTVVVVVVVMFNLFLRHQYKYGYVIFVSVVSLYTCEQSRICCCGINLIMCVCVSGILFSVLIGRYGCRTVTLIGSVIWFIGFIASSVAPNIVTLCFSYGIVAGMLNFLHIFAII